MDLPMLRRELKDEFEREADWRRQKAFEHPDDQRNLDAASEYDRLAATVAKVPNDLIVAYWECFENETESEVKEELLERVFHDGEPRSAAEFCATFVSRVNLGEEPAGKRK